MTDWLPIRAAVPGLSDDPWFWSSKRHCVKEQAQTAEKPPGAELRSAGQPGAAVPPRVVEIAIGENNPVNRQAGVN